MAVTAVSAAKNEYLSCEGMYNVFHGDENNVCL